MFSTRLNPTRPSAPQRAVLERIGAVCRELREARLESWTTAQLGEELRSMFLRHRLWNFGVIPEPSGLGMDPLLVVLAAERLGREGLSVVHWFADEMGALAVTSGAADVQELQARSVADNAETFIHRINRSLCRAGGGIGVLADCLELVAEIGRALLRPDDATSMTSPLGRFVIRTACDLEATRAISYAAAELKHEYDHRPNSHHLRLEAGTLVAEAYAVSVNAVARMFEGTAELTGTKGFVKDQLPAWHRSFFESADALRADAGEAAIARYYLFE